MMASENFHLVLLPDAALVARDALNRAAASDRVMEMARSLMRAAFANQGRIISAEDRVAPLYLEQAIAIAGDDDLRATLLNQIRSF